MRHAIVHQVEVAADWWESMTPQQKKQYIKDHPNSKYAKEAIKDAVPGKGKPASSGGRSSDEKTPGKFPSKIQDRIAMKKAKQAAPKDPHAAAKAAKDAYAEHSRANRKIFDSYNGLLKQLEAAKPGSAKERNLDNLLSELEKDPAIKKAFALKKAQQKAEDAAKNAPKPAAKADDESVELESRIKTLTRRIQDQTRALTNSNSSGAARIKTNLVGLKAERNQLTKRLRKLGGKGDAPKPAAPPASKIKEDREREEDKETERDAGRAKTPAKPATPKKFPTSYQPPEKEGDYARLRRLNNMTREDFPAYPTDKDIARLQKDIRDALPDEKTKAKLDQWIKEARLMRKISR